MAIQVNGTTVIDNSRNLTNIASVDATTVTALGNAGVGGGTAKLVSGNLSGSSYVQYNFSSSYTNFIIAWSGAVGYSTPAVGGSTVRFRLTDSSNTIITGYEYNIDYSSMEGMYTYDYYGGNCSGVAWVINPLNSGSKTCVFIQSAGSGSVGATYSSTQNNRYIMENTEVNNGIILYNDVTNFTSGNYQVYGVK